MIEPAGDGETPRIEVTRDGPYRVTGDVVITDADGVVRAHGGTWHLCRCGGSRHKPFCDATHGRKGFVGTEQASHDTAADRRDEYDAGPITVHDDRSRCAHFGQCTDRLAAVFRADDEPFVDPTGAPPAQIEAVVGGCPSGALAFARSGDPTPVEDDRPPRISPISDGPYRVEGAIAVVDADGEPYDVRERQTLCRCGQSRNKPFCDGSHWYAGFRDPIPVDEQAPVPTVYDALGGLPAIEALIVSFYEGILDEPDPVLEPLFRGMDPDHPRHVAAWLAETFGGPRAYTEHHGGYEHMVAAHRDKALTEEQRQAWLARLLRTADDVGLTDDLDVRSALVAYLEWGTRIAVFNSQPGAPVIEHAPVPRWGWGESAPYVPAPWDAADAAERGRERYAAEQAAQEGQA